MVRGVVFLRFHSALYCNPEGSPEKMSQAREEQL